jgi:hypothetical protein
MMIEINPRVKLNLIPEDKDPSRRYPPRRPALIL